MRGPIEQRHCPACNRETRHVLTRVDRMPYPRTARFLLLSPLVALVNLGLGLADRWHCLKCEDPG